MTDDEINDLIIEHYATSGEVSYVVTFARAIESRTLTNQKAKWYQEGVEAERHNIANMVDNYNKCGAWDSKGQTIVQMIRARGE